MAWNVAMNGRAVCLVFVSQRRYQRVVTHPLDHISGFATNAVRYPLLAPKQTFCRVFRAPLQTNPQATGALAGHLV